MSEKESALEYHQFPTPGKVSVVPTKPCETARDLSLAYSPGVAAPCLEIEKDEELAYTYTSKGNLVAVISNGTAVLGLGNIGPLASKPVMEGKGCLFKAFADIDVFDIELDCRDTEHLIDTVASLAPTFGGINLEDIKAPECFEIETRLQEMLDIPVFHDDQHGTAIISGAGLINALEITGREIGNTKLVINGAGASAISCAKLAVTLGIKRENLIMLDSKGVIYQGRTERMNKYKEEFAAKTEHRTLADAIAGADVFFGLSQKDQLSPDMLLSMADNPIVFAMANPDPEIEYELAKKTRKDVIMATGRSDHPNQVNNVLGFPFIFRGALDVRAKSVNEEMKLAAVHALARLAKEPVLNTVKAAYGNEDFAFGPDYLIPKPFDPRVLYYVSPAVAQAAIESGVARKKIDIDEYTYTLKAKHNYGREMLRGSYGSARKSQNKKRIAYAEGAHERVMAAAIMAFQEGIAEPVLLGKREEIEAQARHYDFDLSQLEVVDPMQDVRHDELVQSYFDCRNRRGVTISEARRAMKYEHNYGCMLLKKGHVDALICGVGKYYSQLIRPVLEIVGLRPGCKYAAAMYMVSVNDRLLFFADTAINTEMTSDKLANIAVMAAGFARRMNITPRVAMLSSSNFGSLKTEEAKMVREATELIKRLAPHLEVDGEMQADAAVDRAILRKSYPFTSLTDAANVLIFPDMQSGNISYKLLQRLGGARVIGPVILGLRGPAHVLQRHSSIDEIFNMTTVAVAQATHSELFYPGFNSIEDEKVNNIAPTEKKRANE